MYFPNGGNGNTDDRRRLDVRFPGKPMKDSFAVQWSDNAVDAK
jgi:hypothetical protein